MAAADLLYNIVARDAGFSTTLARTSKAARRAFDEVGGSVDTAHTKSSRFGSGLGKVGSMLGTVGVLAGRTGVGLAAMGFSKVATDGLAMAQTLETAEQGFTTMLGSAKKSEKFVEDMAAFAAKTPFEFPELAGAAQRMMAFGFRGKDVIPIMTKVGDAVGAMGGSSYEVERVVNALGQMKAKGKVSGEEMLQLTEVGIPAWQLLADKIGITVPEAQERARKGQLDLDTTMNAIIDGMGEKYKGGMEKQATTISGMMSTLRDNVGLALAEVVNPMMPFIKDIIGILSDLAGKAGPALAGVFEKVGPILRNVFDFLKEAGAKILPKLQEYWGELRKAFEDSRPGLEAIAGTFATLGKFILEKVVPALLEISSVVVPAVVKALGVLGKYLPSVAAISLEITKKMVQAFAWMFDAVVGGIEWMIKGLAKIPGPWQKTMQGAAKDVEGFRDKSKAALTGAVKGIEGAQKALWEMGEEARKPKEAKLKADISDAQQKIAEAKALLDNPAVTKERKAKLNAEIADLETKVAEAKRELGTIKDKNVTITAGLVINKVAVTQGVRNKLRGTNSALLTMATGGLVVGPGSGTSDSVPAMLSNGEYVVSAAAVNRYGVDLFNALNFGAAATATGKSAGLPAGGGQTSITVNVYGGLDSSEAIARRVQAALLDLKRRQGVSLGLA